MGEATFRVDAWFLERTLGLPFKARITDIVKVSLNFEPGKYVFHVEHPDLADGKEIHPIWKDKTFAEFVRWKVD